MLCFLVQAVGSVACPRPRSRSYSFRRDVTLGSGRRGTRTLTSEL